jgi:hypothetical protein
MRANEPRTIWRLRYDLPETDPRYLEATDEMIARDLLVQAMRAGDSDRIERGKKTIETVSKAWNEWFGAAAQRFEEQRRMNKAPKIAAGVRPPRRKGKRKGEDS